VRSARPEKRPWRRCRFSVVCSWEPFCGASGSVRTIVSEHSGGSLMKSMLWRACDAAVALSSALPFSAAGQVPSFVKALTEVSARALLDYCAHLCSCLALARLRKRSFCARSAEVRWLVHVVFAEAPDARAQASASALRPTRMSSMR
jgi:hypothetical protein